MKTASVAVGIGIAALSACCGSASAQVGQYFLTPETGAKSVYNVSGGIQISSFSTQPTTARMGPIMVDGSAGEVRYVAGGLAGGGAGPGAAHQFNGVPIGPLSFDLAGQQSVGRVIDAGFDGTNTFVVSGLFGTAAVIRFNDNFSGSGTKAFGVNQSAQGITCDTLTGTIWTTDYDLSGGLGFARQWSMTGELLFSFAVTNGAGVNSERNTALAYDASDDTFWLNATVENTLGMGFGELWQFDRAGHFLTAVNPSPNENRLYWGGEILPIPAPGAAGLLILGGLVAARRRRA